MTPLHLQHEEDVSGVAAVVFADIRSRLAFTPALFKALARDEPALVRAWVQARTLLDDPRFRDATVRLRAVARARPPASPSAALHAAVAPFAAELPGMLLVVSSLALALDERLPRRPPPELGPVTATRPSEPTVPEARDEQPLYPRIRAVYGTEHVPSLYRSLAALGLLEEAWPLAEALLTGEVGERRVAVVAEAGEQEALAFPDAACFDVEGARPVLDQFRRALPRNLVVAVALSDAPR